jgi:hypothetical protein
MRRVPSLLACLCLCLCLCTLLLPCSCASPTHSNSHTHSVLATRFTVLPVFHNALPEHAPLLAELVAQRPYCTISLRHPEAIPALAALGKCMLFF